MAVAIDKAEVYRNAALAKRDRASNRMPATVVRGKIVDFLNSGDSYSPNMESNWPGNKDAAYVVNRLNTIIREDKLSELCFATVTEDGATLVSFVTAES